VAKLKKPAQVGNTVFGVGVSDRLVIERAQREYEYQKMPPIEAKRLRAFKRFVKKLSRPSTRKA
jgi:hypothetical protein